MASPITWRSLQPSADPALGAQLLLASQRSINSAFDPFQKALAEQEAFAASQAGQVREGNKQALLDALSQAKTPEELAALQGSGQLQALQSRLTATDRGAVRGADEARLAGLRQQVTAGQQFDENQVLFNQRQAEDQVAQLIAMGTPQARAQAQEIINTDLTRNKAKFQNAISSAAIAATERDRAAQEFGWKGNEEARKADKAKRDAEVATTENTYKTTLTAASEAARVASVAQQELAKQELAARQAAAKAEAQTRLQKEGGNYYAADGVFNPSNTQDIYKFMVDNKIGDDSDARAAMIKRLVEIGPEIQLPDERSRDGKTVIPGGRVALPLSVVKQAILGASGGFFWNTDADWARSMEANLRNALKQTVTVEGDDGKPLTLNKAAFDFSTYIRGREDAAKDPAVSGSKRTR